MNGRLAGLFCGVAFGALVLSQTSQAADFTVHAGEVVDGPVHLTLPGYVMEIEKDAEVNGTDYAIVEESTDDQVINAGTINGAVAIFSQGAGIVVDNSGTINGLDSNGMGIQSLGDDATITNSGTIQADGEQSTGIMLSGDFAEVTNTGLVQNTGDSGTGIFVGGDDAYVENDGRILATGFRGTGVKLSGADAVFLNSNLVSASGSGSFALHSLGANAWIVNLNTIEATDEANVGIYSVGDDAVIVNTGDVLSTNDGGFAILSTGANAEIDNYGKIEASGTGSISVNIHGAAMVNTGTVSNSGNFGAAIVTEIKGTTLSNTGTIVASGHAAIAVDAQGADAWIVNDGEIRAPGDEGIAVVTEENGATFTNGGAVSATGLDGVAFDFYGADTTLNLLNGMTVEGRIEYLNPRSGTIDIARGLNAALTIGGMPATIETHGQPYTISGDTLIVVDQTGFAATDAFAFDLTRVVADTVDAADGGPRRRRTVTTGALPGASEIGPAQLLDLRPRPLWRPAATASLDGFELRGRRSSSSAPTARFPRPTRRASSPADRSAGSRPPSAPRAITNSGGFAGAYWSHDDGRAFRNLSVTLGGIETESKRIVANNTVAGGLETASGSYGSFYISPAATFGIHRQFGRATVSPSVRLRYTGLFTPGFSETGSAGDLSVASRFAQAIDVRAQVKAELGGLVGEAGVGRIGVRAGVDGILTFGGKFDATALGSDIDFDVDGENGAGPRLRRRRCELRRRERHETEPRRRRRLRHGRHIHGEGHGKPRQDLLTKPCRQRAVGGWPTNAAGRRRLHPMRPGLSGTDRVHA